ncbi:MAG TPA: FprA family A-type flavoprotein, partial [Candidatus Acetothermia bacterium]|nr:FprA family A-type flavoprotein [Candidatus Acetothermia bacterium]
TYEETEGVLFSCDAFGGFRALDGGLFDEEVDLSEYEDEALRYFANIVGMYTHNVLKAIEKLQGLEIRTIAPSHGLIWRRDPGRIVDLYRRWSRMEGEKGVTVVFGSMYGFTLRMAEAVARGVASVGVPVRLVDAARVHPSYVLLEVWKRRGLIVGAPTYDAGIFPPVELALRLLERKRLRNRVVGLFGSFGWGGGALKAMEELAKRNGWELVRTLPFRGSPSAEELRDGEELGREVAERVVRGA